MESSRRISEYLATGNFGSGKRDSFGKILRLKINLEIFRRNRRREKSLKATQMRKMTRTLRMVTVMIMRVGGIQMRYRSKSGDGSELELHSSLALQGSKASYESPIQIKIAASKISAFQTGSRRIQFAKLVHRIQVWK